MRRAWRLPLLFALVWLAATGYLAARLNVVSDMGIFLPPGAGLSERLMVEELRSGVGGRLILVGLDDATPTTLADANRRLATRLRGDARFALVSNGDEGLSAETQRLLFDARYLLSPAVSAERFSVESLRAALVAQLEQLASSLGFASKQWLAADPTGEFFAVLRQWQPVATLTRVEGVLFSADERRSLMVLRTQAPGHDLNAQAEALARVRSEFAALGAGAVQLHLAGAPVYAVATRAQVRADASRLSILATVLVLIFLYAAFRSLRAVFLSALPLLFGITAGLLAVAVAFDQVHGITIAFGSTLIGVAVDYPLHFLSHLTQPWRSPHEQLKHIWPTLRLGAFTTVIAFAALAFSGHGGLAQLGIFSVAGIIAAAATTRWLLPALVPRDFCLRVRRGATHRRLEKLARVAPRWKWPLAFVVLAAIVTLALMRAQVWEDDVAKLTVMDPALKQEDARLRADVGAPGVGRLLVLAAPTAEAVLQRSEALVPTLQALVAQGALGGFDMAALYLPSAERQRAQQATLPEQVLLQSNLNAALRGLPLRAQAFAPFVADVARAHTQTPVTPGDFAATPLAERLRPLLFEFDGQWLAPVLLRDVREAAALAALAQRDSEGGGETLYLDTRAESTRLMAHYRDRALVWSGWGALGIFAVLWIGLGGLRRALAVLLSPLAAIAVVCAGFVASGVGLTLFHVVALLLVLGLGIDYALYFERLGRHREEWDTTFPALWKAWLTTVIGFATLAWSSMPVLHAMGVTVAVGVTLCFVFAAAWARRERRVNG